MHDMVSIGGRQQTVLFPAEQEKLLESLMTQVAPPGGAQREARVICFSMICLAVGVASVLVMSVLVVVLMVLVVVVAVGCPGYSRPSAPPPFCRLH